MDELAPAGSIARACCEALSETGPLSALIPGFVARTSQVTMALAIAVAIEKQTLLVAEAGTGTGKTFAYLIPCLLSGKKVVISTATKTLQDQLYEKDLPLLRRALGLPVRVQNLKGRANYLCLHRIHQYATEGQFTTLQAAQDIALIRQRLPRLKAGVRTELSEIKEDAAVWPYATSTTENCLGTECGHYQACFLVKARRRALTADVVVINHHLFFADSKLKEEGFGELLPGVEAVVFDEAHQLADIAAVFYADRVSTRQMQGLLEELIQAWPVLDLDNQPFAALRTQLDNYIAQWLYDFPSREERLPWHEAIKMPRFMSIWKGIMAVMSALLAVIEKARCREEATVRQCEITLKALITNLELFTQPSALRICWVERFRQTLVFHATPVEVGSAFGALLTAKPCAFVFTSATLTMAGSFHCFTRSLGLDALDTETLCLPSPFDYKTQALLYLPRSLPDPASSQYYEALVARVLPLVNALGGRCFFLFTSHRALQLTADILRPVLTYPLLIQGEESKSLLLERFRALGNAVLLGTSTFWEGVDVKGDALSCVIIDKLPFASPSDPVIQGKMAYLKSQGLSAFNEMVLPDAILALKQGVGRLIRDSKDRGVLMIADPRLTARDYGQAVLLSLPLLRKTRTEQTVLDFIKELDYESVSD